MLEFRLYVGGSIEKHRSVPSCGPQKVKCGPLWLASAQPTPSCRGYSRISPHSSLPHPNAIGFDWRIRGPSRSVPLALGHLMSRLFDRIEDFALIAV